MKHKFKIKNNLGKLATLKDVQNEMLYLLRIVDRVCREHNIQYWLDCGTLLGCVRHQGFIPWDYDIDLAVPIWEYYKLLALLHEESQKNDNVFLYYFKQQESHLYEHFGSKRIIYHYYPGKSLACKIDIFPMKFINQSQRAEDERITNIAYYFVSGDIYDSKNFDMQYTKGGLRVALEKKQKFMDYFNYEYLPSCDKKEAHSLAIYSFGKTHNNSQSYYRYADIFPLKELSFEGYNFFVPHNTDAHLSKNYDNYMLVPPKKQRVSYSFKHYFSKDKEHTLKLTRQYIHNSNRLFYPRLFHDLIYNIHKCIFAIKAKGIKYFIKKFTRTIIKVVSRSLVTSK